MSGALARRLAAEALGTGFLVATVVGSGIMAETLTKDTGLVLLGNTLPTGAILVVLITIFGPISDVYQRLPRSCGNSVHQFSRHVFRAPRSS